MRNFASPWTFFFLQWCYRKANEDKWPLALVT
jgi:hypothetical protein